MAQLKNTLITGNAGITGDLNLIGTLTLNSSQGTAGQVLKVNSSANGVEWGTVSASDTNVAQAYSTTNNNYPILMSSVSGVSATTDRGNTTAIVNNLLYFNPSTGYINDAIQPLAQIGSNGNNYTYGAGIKFSPLSGATHYCTIDVARDTANEIDYLRLGGRKVTDNTMTSNTTVRVNVIDGIILGAAWNDYAEYRRAQTPITPGRVIVDTDEGAVILATERLQPGAQVVSDTYGFIEGETKDAKTPIAVAGRVLVYPYRSRAEYHAGMCVCSAPNGTVDIMTRDEIKEYPDCIIGIVSEIPTYETWGESNVKVDGRIWVRVK